VAAMFQARKLTDRVVLAQIYGRGIVRRLDSPSFCMESWDSANSPIPWGSVPLTIDRRDRDREDRVIGMAGIKPGRPVVLMALGGNSSPYPYATFVRANLQRQIGGAFQVVDITDLRCERIYDLLGLYELATALITTDSAPLHLSAAVPGLPVIALATRWPTSWHGTPWRSNQRLRVYYDETLDRWEEILEACRTPAGRPKIVHVWADFRAEETPDEDTRRRMAVAHASWDLEAKAAPGVWTRLQFPADRRRTSREVGDSRPVPYILDFIDHALQLARDPDDIIAWSNSDVSFAPGLTGQVVDRCRRFGAAFTHRWDFERLAQPFVSAAMIRRGKFYPGSDAFFFTRRWWLEYGHDYPDMIMGREKNDEVFRQLIKLHAGTEAEIEAAVYHEKHASFWESPEHFATNPGNEYNRRLAAGWFKKHGLKENDFIWWTGPVDRTTR